MVFTSDIVHKQKERKKDLMCSVYGTGMITYWMYLENDKVQKVNWLIENKHLLHSPDIQTIATKLLQ